MVELTKEEHRLKLKVAKSKLVWLERDGTVTPVAQMSDHHLKSSIEMIQRSISENKWWRTDQLQYLKEERHYRALINKKGVRICRHRSKNTTSLLMKETN